VSRYRFIEVEKVNHAVRTLCRVLQVSRAAYYHWSINPLSVRARADLALTERIAAIHARSRQTYGAPRVHAELQVCGDRHGRKRIARLMHAAGLAGRIPKRYRHTAVADPLTVIPDLVRRDFTPTHPDQLWVGDITYIRTWEGWLYLATLLDCFSRRVVGWAMADHLRTEFPLGALHMALARRSLTGTLIHHTDRGCQPGLKGSSQRYLPGRRLCSHSRPLRVSANRGSSVVAR
jgi:transposase InsO family protein